MNKRLIALLLLIAVVFTACAQPQAEVEAPASQDTEQEMQAESQVEPEEESGVETQDGADADPQIGNTQDTAGEFKIVGNAEFSATDTQPTQTSDSPKIPATQEDLEELKQYFAGFDSSQLDTFVATLHIVESYGLADTQIPVTVVDEVLAALTSMQPTLIPPEEAFEELRNPYTGGGESVYIAQGDLQATISYGGFFGIWTPKTGTLYFNMVSQSPIGAVNNFVDELSATAPPSVDTAPATQVLYRGQEITSMYAVDSEMGLTAIVTPTQDLIEELDEYRLDYPDEVEEYARYGYIIYTGADKEYVYLGETAPDADVDRCKYSFGDSLNLRIHWLTHMDPYKIQKVKFDGMDSSYSSSVGVLTTSPEEIMEIAQAVKDLLPTTPATITRGRQNFDTPASLFTLDIAFNTGVEYNCFGYENSIYIYSSDLDKTMSYEVKENSLDLLRDTMAGINNN